MAMPTQGVIDEQGQWELPIPVSDRVASYLIQFESESFNGSVTIKGAALDTGEDFTPLALAYKKMTTGLNATAAITGNALVLVDSAGVGISLACTSYVGGEMRFKAVPMIG
jgi:hypothetical protein